MEMIDTDEICLCLSPLEVSVERVDTDEIPLASRLSA